MKRNGLTDLTILVLIMVTAQTEGQQWQLGHQPPHHTLPQYQPLQAPVPVPPQDQDHAERYPLFEVLPDGPPVAQVPRAAETLPVDAMLPYELQAVTPDPSSATAFAAVNAPSTEINPRYGLDYSIYRDYSPYPIDPRKPCNDCTRGFAQNGLCGRQWPGKNGRPYQDREPGSCECSKVGHRKIDRFSVNWPAPFSMLRDSHSHHLDACKALRPRINDRFNHLESFKLVDDHRTDNGYYGWSADPYGCLGESRVMGVGFRSPGAPAAIPVR